MRRVRQEFGDEDRLLSERDPEWEELSAAQNLAGLLDRYGERELRELARIEAAVRRIDAGTYGRCKSCGTQISTDRLLSLPEASLCTDCQELEETTAAPPPET